MPPAKSNSSPALLEVVPGSTTTCGLELEGSIQHLVAQRTSRLFSRAMSGRSVEVDLAGGIGPPIVPALAPRLRHQVQAADLGCAVEGLRGVVEAQGRDGRRRQGFHLHARAVVRANS